MILSSPQSRDILPIISSSPRGGFLDAGGEIQVQPRAARFGVTAGGTPLPPELCLDQTRFEKTPVNEFVDGFVI